MRHVLYEDPITRRFALIRLPPKHVEGETVPIPLTARWFSSREEVLARISDLFDCEEDGQDAGATH